MKLLVRSAIVLLIIVPFISFSQSTNNYLSIKYEYTFSYPSSWSKMSESHRKIHEKYLEDMTTKDINLEVGFNNDYTEQSGYPRIIVQPFKTPSNLYVSMKKKFNAKNIVEIKRRTKAPIFNIVDGLILAESICDDNKEFILVFSESVFNNKDVLTVTALYFSGDTAVQIIMNCFKADQSKYSKDFEVILSTFEFL